MCFKDGNDHRRDHTDPDYCPSQNKSIVNGILELGRENEVAR